MKVIYNVLIAGTSIGITFRKSEAEAWVKQSNHPGEKKIVMQGAK